MSPKYLNLGCGMFQGEHWVNIDGSPNVILDNRPLLKRILSPFLPESSKKNTFQGCVYLDLRNAWSFETNSIDAIYSSHCFEHLSLEDGEKVLKECFRVLKPNGLLRLVVPSIEIEINKYLESKRKGDPFAASHFAKAAEVFQNPIRGPWWYKLFMQIYDKNSHKWFYDNESLMQYVNNAGFENSEIKQFLETSIPHIKEIEQWYKVSDSVCLEAKKPAA